MVWTHKETLEISEGQTDNVSVDCRDNLAQGELVTGTPVVAEITTNDLSLTNEQVNTTEVVVLGREVPIGKAVLFTISGQNAGTTYRIRITHTTDSTPARVIPFDVLLRCVS